MLNMMKIWSLWEEEYCPTCENFHWENHGQFSHCEHPKSLRKIKYQYDSPFWWIDDTVAIGVDRSGIVYSEPKGWTAVSHNLMMISS